MQYDYGLGGSHLMKLDLYVNVRSVTQETNKKKWVNF